MATKVLDSWALMAFLHDEPAAEEVEELLVKAAEDKHKLLLLLLSVACSFWSSAHERRSPTRRVEASECASKREAQESLTAFCRARGANGKSCP
jgi:hypothetical protein